MKWATFLLVFFIPACKTKGPSCLIDAAEIMKGASRKLIVVKDAKYKISALYDDGWDSLKGGAYIFYPNELLKSYTFYQNRLPVYTEEYDNHGHLVNTKGSPMVDRVINELNEDSAYVQVYFFSPKKTYQQLNIKINKNPAANFKLVADSVYSNMRSVTFGITMTDLTSVNMYSQIKYTDECSHVEHVLSDSLFLFKDSRNGLMPVNTK